MKKVILAFIYLILAIPCPARTITVDDNAPADFNNIQAAIGDANDGDTIIVADGRYTGQGNRDINFLGKVITLQSENGPENCIIDCNGTYEENHRGFYFLNGEIANSILDGFTITKGYVVVICKGGAGVYLDNSSPTIRNCIIKGNVAELDPYSLCFCYGGGIYVGKGSRPTITTCMINGNSVGKYGLGGGICCYYDSSTTIRNCIISNNTATTPYDTAGMGGGIYCDYYTTLTMVNCTIAENTASFDGGGIFFEPPQDRRDIKIINSIIWDNSPNQIATYGSSKAWVIFCDVQGGCLWYPTNMDENPLFGNPANEDYHLKSRVGRWNPNQNEWVTDANTSPCIDSGTFTYWTEELWPHGKRTNMGAYGGTSQASMSPLDIGNIADFNNDDNVDLADMKLFTYQWLCGEVLLPEDINRNGFVDFDDFATFADNWPWP